MATGRGRGRAYDRDFDGPQPAPATRRRRTPYEGHQRLVANPFLAVLGTLAWFAAVRQTVRVKRLDLFLPALACLVLVVFLFQYHCLDCGATGRLTRWRRHACERVVRRSESGAVPGVRRLSPVAQTVLAFYLLVLAAVVWWIAAR